MIKFIKRTLYVFIGVSILLEIITRIFSLSAHTLEQSNINGDRLLKPGSSGCFVRGGLKEINAYYEINPQGWNSVRDYEFDLLDSTSSKIAIVGDSFIEGLNTDVHKSIGRLLENKLNNSFIVHEYGAAGGNIQDYMLLYSKYNLEKYDYVFIKMADDDLFQNQPLFINKGGSVTKKSLMRKVYDSSSLLRYLNINHGLGVKLNKMLNGKTNGNTKLNRNRIKEITNKGVGIFQDNVIVFYDGNLDSEIINILNLPTISVRHTMKPYNYGFDKHWNIIGRYNVALSLANYINYNKL